MIHFDSTICTDFSAASSREWLETNGVGGFASGTIAGSNSRRYHGLLTAATKPPLGRITLVSKIEETVMVNGEAFELSSNQYPDRVHPRGFENLTSFRLDPFPIWTYAIANVEIEKRVFMVHGQNTTVARYAVKTKGRGKKPVVIMTLRPMLSFVDYHHLRRETAEFNGDYYTTNGTIEIRPMTDMPTLFVSHNGTDVAKTGYWYRVFDFAIEK